MTTTPVWVWALPEIMGDDAVPVGDRGDIVKMTAAWLRWAKFDEAHDHRGKA
jgi:hypothetical protein